MSFHYRHRKVILGCILCLLIICGGGVYFYKKNFKDNKKSNTKNTSVVIKKSKNLSSLKKEEQEEYFKVDIKGEVNNPGIYSLKINSRVIDVINSAGGLSENADTTVLNLSKKIKDEMVIIVYSKEEVADFKKTKEIEKQVQDKCVKKDSDSLINDGCIDDKTTVSDTNSSKININTASIQELKNLPGIGEAKAKNIIDTRNKNGLFKSIDDIKNIEGIGESIYAQIKDFITVE